MQNAGKRAQNDASISFAEQERFRRSLIRWLLPIRVDAQDWH